LVESCTTSSNLFRRIVEDQRILASADARLFCGVIALFPIFEFKSISMKNLVLISFLTLVATSLNAQKIFSVDAEYKANVKVFVVDAEYKADLLVYKENAEYKAGSNDGKWFFVDAEYKAQKKIYFVDAEYKGELKVFFVDAEYKAGWKNASKKHLLY
jgi:hypothetical protein